MNESLTHNGRPQHIGGFYAQMNWKTGEYESRWCVGYCDCGKKVGLTRTQFEQLANELPPKFWFFIYRLLKTRILIPR
jgi:hypothetical protein